MNPEFLTSQFLPLPAHYFFSSNAACLAVFLDLFFFQNIPAFLNFVSAFLKKKAFIANTLQHLDQLS